MNSLTDTVKKHGLILWLCHLLESLVVNAVIAGILLTGILTAVGIGIGVTSMFSVTMKDIVKAVGQLSPLALGGGTDVLLVLAVFIYALAGSFGKAGTIAVTSNAVSRDEATFQMFFREGLKNMWRMLGLWAAFLLLFVPIIFSGILIVLFLKSTGLAVLFGLLLVVFFILATLGLLFSQYILIAEKETIWRSIKASFSLLGRQFGEVVITALILFGVVLAFSMLQIAIIGDRGAGLLIFYDLIIAPIMATTFTLVIVYRYFRYMRPALYPPEAEVVEPVIDVNDEMDKTEL